MIKFSLTFKVSSQLGVDKFIDFPEFNLFNTVNNH